MEDFRPEIVYILDVINASADTISRLDMDPTCNIREEMLKDSDENNYMYGKYMHLNRVLNKSL